MLNPFFTQGTKSEQSLVQDLINEQLRMYGVDIFYIPRKYITEKTVLREVVQSKFDMALPLEAYVDNFDEYAGAGTILSKFGIQSQDEVRLVISRERFENYISPLIEDQTNIKLSTRPKTGDLIWFPLDDRVYEVKDIEYAKPYYQLQDLYVYELTCELFRVEDEVIATGIEEIDNVLVGDDLDGVTVDGINTIQGHTQTLTVVGTGVTATAVTNIVNGGIRYVTISNRGGGYIGAPSVGFSSAPSGGMTGIGTAVLIAGIVVCNKSVNAATRSVQEINLKNVGFGYTVAPEIKVTSTSGTGFAGTSFIGDGVVGIITVSNGGGGYVVPPTITFTGVSSVSAAATAMINPAGIITAINIQNAGLGYTVAPTISIGAPNMNSTGNYVFNEVVTGSVSGATARVRTWDSSTSIIEIASITGTFVAEEYVVGATSGASHALRVINVDPIDDGFADNVNIENFANSILDFSEANPFGIP